MTNRAADPREWQVSGYYPAENPNAKMRRSEARLDHHIVCSKKISTLLLNWAWNLLIVGGMAAGITLLVSGIVLFLAFIGFRF